MCRDGNCRNVWQSFVNPCQARGAETELRRPQAWVKMHFSSNEDELHFELLIQTSGRAFLF